ncbi:sugar-binding domain-containing protein [Methylocystis sp. JR02]|uniref:glycoside hydrolase family 2 protein n=1 Tax=Methylocystis sp. JR02 TaxID=3046284 RepID=UPI0024B9F999|nr:sugar-binding domain-containing protein [Methylocystis sp. JR02]MDJ0449078.1 glycoside hydrolase family 2 TIM barrel-domain containing protein [Methylocystis sp. JR02]
MNKARISLDGMWEFQYLGGGASARAERRSIVVPSPWQAQFPDLSMRGGVGVYRRSVDVPADWLSQRIFVHFGAVFHIAHVFVNGALVGSHVGGFLPFYFDITDRLVEGRAEIEVRVESPTDDPAEFPHTPFAEMPFGKQSWYGPLSGIWQSVYLERNIPDRLTCLRVRADLDSGDIAALLQYERALCARTEALLEVFGPQGECVASTKTELACGAEHTTLRAQAPNPQAWSPDAPNLYRLRVQLMRDGMKIDEKETTFGFRKIETRDGKLYLNDKPFYLRAALDQDYYPDTICTPPSLAFIEDRFRKAKALGLNALRCHIKAPDPRYYEAADRLGLLVWAELPNGGYSTERSRERKETTLKGIIDRDGNHPSIFCWTLINENWGVDLVHDAKHRAWLRRLYLWLKAYDPTRLVVDNSPLAPSFHVQSDLADYHFYAAIPDSRHDWDRFVDALADRGDWLFSPEGDAVTTGKEPLLCSEFGNWGLPDPEKLNDALGREPWWFETGHDWGEGVMYPHGVLNRFHDWSLDRVFGSFEGFIEATQWQQFRALKYEIEAMRRRAEISGYVITELTDCHWESNGLLDMRSNTRAFHDVFHSINADTVIVPRLERAAFWAGETLQVPVRIAHGGSDALEPGTLEILSDWSQTMPTPRIEAGSVADMGVISFELPQVDKSSMRQVSFHLRAANGEIIASNDIEVALHPARATPPALSLWSPEPDVRVRLQAFGYRLATGMNDADVVVALRNTSDLADHVRTGGRAVLLPEDEGTLTPFFPHWQNVKVVARDGTLWRGDWASSFAWLRRRGPFRGLPGGPMIDQTFDRVIPTHVISGCNLLDFHARVHAALAVGWIHKPVGLAVERFYGEGHIVISTFRLLRDPASADPTATVLFDALVAMAAKKSETTPAVEPTKLESA